MLARAGCRIPDVITVGAFCSQMMRNIFIKCFNTCRTKSEGELSDTWALRHMRFSPRLFDIKLFQRMETVAYFEDADMFVLAEGEANRCYNFQTGWASSKVFYSSSRP